MRRTDKLWLGLLFSFLLFVTANVWADSNNPVRIIGAQTPGDCVQISSTNVLSDSGSACGGGGGGSVAIAASTSNINYYALFATNTSSSASTIFIDKASPFTYNPSTGVSSFLGLVTSSLTNNGNASLSGTTTLGTVQIAAGNAILTTITGTTGNFSTLNYTNALGITSTVTTANVVTSFVDNGTAALKGTTTISGALNDTATISLTGIVAGTVSGNQYLGVNSSNNVVYTAGASPVLQPLSVTTTETLGNEFPYTYFDSTTTGALAIGAPAWGTAASLSADTYLRFRFKMPHVLPTAGVLNLCTLCQANATTGNVKYSVLDSAIAVNNTASVGATPLTTETQTSITWSAVDNYVETCTPLTNTPGVDGISAGAIKYTTSGWTLAQILSCNLTETWR